MTPLEIYNGSDGEATKQLYADLERLGPVGVVALNLFRAHKCSARAKVYRGGRRGHGSFRAMAYDRKQWSMDNLCQTLTTSAASLGICWGWKQDPAQEFHRWVLYVDLPTGQVSFHTSARGHGPDYPGDWDGIRDAGAARIIAWINALLNPPNNPPPINPPIHQSINPSILPHPSSDPHRL